MEGLICSAKKVKLYISGNPVIKELCEGDRQGQICILERSLRDYSAGIFGEELGNRLEEYKVMRRLYPKSGRLMMKAYLEQLALGLERERQHSPSSLAVQIFRFMNGVS